MKERLLGAAVLILAAVLIVPMLLDGPDRDKSQVTRELELPAPESTPPRTHVVELDTSDSGSGQDTVPDAVEPIPEPAVSASAVQTDNAPIPEPTVSVPAVDTGSAGGQPPVATQRPTPPSEVPGASQQGWAVQVGSFTSEPNARRLAGLLQASDYPAFVMRSVVQGRVMYRVRVGPEPDRIGAEMLAERLRADRQTTQLVQHP